MLPRVWSNVFLIVAHDVCHPAYDGPWVHDALPASYESLSFIRSVIKPPDHLTSHYLSLLLCHLDAHSENHEHVVYAVDSHGIDVTDCVAASNPTLHVGVVHKRVEEVCRRDQVLSRVVFVLCHATVGGLLSDGAIPDIFQILKEGSGRYLAPSPLEGCVADQTEIFV
jgi:hypothetical protein